MLEPRRPVVALLTSGRPLTLPWLFERGRGGAGHMVSRRGGGPRDRRRPDRALQSVGRLPVTWPRAVGQMPIFYAPRPSGRPFRPTIAIRANISTLRSRRNSISDTACLIAGSRFSIFSTRGKEPSGFGRRNPPQRRYRQRGPGYGEATVFLFRAGRCGLCRAAAARMETVWPWIALKAGAKGTCWISWLPAIELSFPGLDLKPRFEAGAFAFSVGFSADPGGLTTIRLRALPEA